MLPWLFGLFWPFLNFLRRKKERTFSSTSPPLKTNLHLLTNGRVGILKNTSLYLLKCGITLQAGHIPRLLLHFHRTRPPNCRLTTQNRSCLPACSLKLTQTSSLKSKLLLLLRCLASACGYGSCQKSPLLNIPA